MHPELDKVIIDWTINTIMNHWKEDTIEPNFVDVICSCRGWMPLEKNEKIDIHYGNKEYTIIRTK